MALKKEKEKKPKENKPKKEKKPRVSSKVFARGRKDAAPEAQEVVFGAVTPDAPEEPAPAFSHALMPEGDGFMAGVRSADPVLSVDDSAAGTGWKSELASIIAGAVLLLAFMSLFCMAAYASEVIPFLVPGALVFAGLSILGAVKPGKAKWIAAAVVAALLAASMAVLHSTIGGGLADLINQFYDICEQTQAYIYDRIPAEGGTMSLGALWISCVIGLLAALPPAGARRGMFYCVTIIAMLAFAYYGLVPSWIGVAVLLAALLTAIGGSNALSSLPLLLAVMLIFVAVVVIDPGENYGISRMDENFRDRFAFNSSLIQNDTGIDDLSGLEDLDNQDNDKTKDEGGFENDLGSYTGIIIAAAIVLAVAAALFLLWNRWKKKQAELRKGIDSTDPRVAVTAMFPYSVRWLKASGMDMPSGPFSELTPVVRSELSEDYAKHYSDMYLLWREAAYSDHALDEKARNDMDSFMHETIDAVNDKWNLGEKISRRFRYSL